MHSRELSIPQVEPLVLGGPPVFDTCSFYDVDYDQVLREKLRPNSSWKTAPCRNGWNYDLEQTRYNTIVSEVGLAQLNHVFLMYLLAAHNNSLLINRVN